MYLGYKFWQNDRKYEIAYNSQLDLGDNTKVEVKKIRRINIGLRSYESLT